MMHHLASLVLIKIAQMLLQFKMKGSWSQRLAFTFPEIITVYSSPLWPAALHSYVRASLDTADSFCFMVIWLLTVHFLSKWRVQWVNSIAMGSQHWWTQSESVACNIPPDTVIFSPGSELWLQSQSSDTFWKDIHVVFSVFTFQLLLFISDSWPVMPSCPSLLPLSWFPSPDAKSGLSKLCVWVCVCVHSYLPARATCQELKFYILLIQSFHCGAFGWFIICIKMSRRSVNLKWSHKPDSPGPEQWGMLLDVRPSFYKTHPELKGLGVGSCIGCFCYWRRTSNGLTRTVSAPELVPRACPVRMCAFDVGYRLHFCGNSRRVELFTAG